MSDVQTVTPEAEPREACLCGCGETPKHKKSRFMPGHDAQLKAELYKLVRDEATPDDERQLAVDRLDGFGWPQPAPKKARKRTPKADKADNGDAPAESGEVTAADL